MEINLTTIIVALVSLFGTVSATGGVLYLVVKKSFERKGDVNTILRETVKDLQFIHKEEIGRLHELHKLELEKVHESYQNRIMVLEGKVDALREIIDSYEEQHTVALDYIKKKLD